MRSQSAAAINNSEMRLSISKIQDVETGDEDDVKEDSENGEEELGLETKKSMLKQSWHATFLFFFLCMICHFVVILNYQ